MPVPDGTWPVDPSSHIPFVYSPLDLVEESPETPESRRSTAAPGTNRLALDGTRDRSGKLAFEDFNPPSRLSKSFNIEGLIPSD